MKLFSTMKYDEFIFLYQMIDLAFLHNHKHAPQYGCYWYSRV